MVSLTTSLLGCGLPFITLGLHLPSVPPRVNPGVRIGIPPKHDSVPHGGFGGMFSSCAIVVIKPIFIFIFFLFWPQIHLIYNDNASKIKR